MRILMPVYRGAPADGFYFEFLRGISEALIELGHKPIGFPFTSPEKPTQQEAFALCRLVSQEQVDVVLDLAAWGYSLSRIKVSGTSAGSAPIFAATGIPYVALLLDHPQFQALDGICATSLYAAYPDLDHPAQARMIYPALAARIDLISPPGVRRAWDCSAPQGCAGREMDVLYVGNLHPGPLARFWNDRGSVGWRESIHAEFCDALTDLVIENPERAFHASALSACEALRIDPVGFDFASQFRAVELHLRFRYRRDAVVALAGSGVSLTVIGDGWEQLNLPANARVHPPVAYQEFLQLMGRAKVHLDASTYLQGANDRIFAAAINRTVSFTNAAGYLSADGEAVPWRFYSMQHLSELGDRLRDLLERPHALSQYGEQARDLALSHHTWRHRIENILGRLSTSDEGGRR